VIVSIYGLSDPRDATVRYVGQSATPRARYSSHLSGQGRSENAAKAAWLEELDALGLRPTLVILDNCDSAQAGAAEERWIDSLRAAGPLYNAPRKVAKHQVRRNPPAAWLRVKIPCNPRERRALELAASALTKNIPGAKLPVQQYVLQAALTKAAQEGFTPEDEPKNGGRK
jgi:hypothetical protein